MRNRSAGERDSGRGGRSAPGRTWRWGVAHAKLLLIIAALFAVLTVLGAPACQNSTRTAGRVQSHELGFDATRPPQAHERIVADESFSLSAEAAPARAAPETDTAWFAKRRLRDGSRAFVDGTGLAPTPPPPPPPAPGDAREGERAAQIYGAPSIALAPGEELWVIPTDRTRQATEQHRRDNPNPVTSPMCFAGMEPDAPIDELLAMLLQHTDVRAAIDGYVSSVSVEQVFANPFDVKIEAVYVFPLPQMAAVNDFVMTIGDRKIRGVIRPRAEAERIYRQARARGHVASLLTQERPNIFTQRVANIEPGKQVAVDITYYQALPYRDGAFEFVFPMVVGPRYNPAGSSDPVNAAARGARVNDNASGTTVTYLSPNERTGHNVSLSIDVDARLPIASIGSNTHKVSVRRTGSTTALVDLSELDRIPNRDFVLRIEIDRSELASSLIYSPDPAASGDGVERGTFSLMIVPPDEAPAASRRPVEFIFVIDCSGSMNGPHMEIAKAGARRGLRSLQQGDTFNIVRFASGAETFSAAPLAATPDNIEGGLRFIDSTKAGGGTEALSGIRAALSPTADAERERLVVFMTDGLIGNEAEVLGTIARDLQGARIFSFGVGSSPNRFLMERMAKLGRGAVAFLGSNDSGSDVIDAFFTRISSPVLADVFIDAEGLSLSGVYPTNNIDVLPGRPLIVTGRYEGALPSSIELAGMRGRALVRETVQTQRIDAASRSTGGVLATLWARTRIAHLADASSSNTSPEIPAEIERLALSHNLVSAVTAFIAVDSAVVTDGSHGVTVRQPVNVPEGVRYETTVGPGR